MKTSTLRTTHDSLLDATAFADRHPEIRDVLARHLDAAHIVPIAGSKRIVVAVTGQPEPRVILSDLIGAAHADGIPVRVEPGGRYLDVLLDFDGLTLAVFDYQTTHGEDSVLYALARDQAAERAAIAPGDTVRLYVSDAPDLVSGTVARVYLNVIGEEVADVVFSDDSTFVQCTRLLYPAGAR